VRRGSHITLLLAAFLACAPDGLGAAAAFAQPPPAERPDDSSEDAGLRRLGVSPERDPERLIRAVRRLLRIRRQMGVGGRGDVARYRDAVEDFARFLKRDNVGLVREAVQRADVAYSRLDRVWLDGLAARVARGADIVDVLSAEPGKLAETIAIGEEIARSLAEIQRLIGEGEHREIELDRTFRNLIRLGEEARTTRTEIEALAPPPAVLLLVEEIHATFEAEVRPLRQRADGLRGLRERFGRGADRPERLERLRAMRAAVAEIRAVQRALGDARPGGRR